MELTTARVVVDTSKDITSSLKLMKSNILGSTIQSERRRTNTVRDTNVEHLDEVTEELIVVKVVLTKSNSNFAKVLKVKEDIGKKFHDWSEQFPNTTQDLLLKNAKPIGISCGGILS